MHAVLLRCVGGAHGVLHLRLLSLVGVVPWLHAGVTYSVLFSICLLHEFRMVLFRHVGFLQPLEKSLELGSNVWTLQCFRKPKPDETHPYGN